MYKPYNHGCPPQPKTRLEPACCYNRLAGSSQAGANPGAIPESARILQQQCSTLWVTTVLPTNCIVGNGSGSTVEKVKLAVPSNPGSAPVPVPVTNLSASLITQMKGSDVLLAASDPYNPATRFAQYFPPQPPGVPCPERLPSRDPKPSTRDCVPVSRFHGSDWTPPAQT
jgi:hypothetical protein